MKVANDANRSETPSAEVETSVYRVTLQDYWVDFLGGLLPGALVIVALLAMFLPMILLLANIASGRDDVTFGTTLGSMLRSTANTPSMLWVGVAGIAFAVVYIVGHIFYRKDPKKPNQKSLHQLMKKEARRKDIRVADYLQYLGRQKRNEDDEGEEEEFRKFRETMQKEYACRSDEDCEFPFPYFASYLENRGLSYLDKYVPWKDDVDIRTKNFVNILKVRLRFHYPNRCGIIIRNEAHVRLASSTWYVGKVISISAVVAIVLLMLVYLFLRFSGEVPDTFLDGYNAQFLVIFVVLILFAALGWLMRKHIESFLHYQRQREVVHVLETAWTAFEESETILYPPFGDG